MNEPSILGVVNMCDWTEVLMVIITGIYMAATLYLAHLNKESNNLLKKQIEINEEQYRENSRAKVLLSPVMMDDTIVLRIKNDGMLTAENIQITWKGDICYGSQFKSKHEELKRINFNLSPGTSWDLPIVIPNILRDFDGDMCEINVRYSCRGIEYEETVRLKLDEYDWTYEFLFGGRELNVIRNTVKAKDKYH